MKEYLSEDSVLEVKTYNDGDAVLADDFNTITVIANKVSTQIDNFDNKVSAKVNEFDSKVNSKVEEISTFIKNEKNEFNTVLDVVKTGVEETRVKANGVSEKIKDFEIFVNNKNDDIVANINNNKNELNAIANKNKEDLLAIASVKKDELITIANNQKDEYNALDTKIKVAADKLNTANEEFDTALSRLAESEGKLSTLKTTVDELNIDVGEITPNIEETKSIMKTLVSEVDYSDIDKIGTPKIEIVKNKFKFSSLAGKGFNYAGTWTPLKSYKGKDQYNEIDVVTYNGDMYACIKTNVASTVSLPNNTEYWEITVSASDKTKVIINNEKYPVLNFSSDPQTQLDNKLNKSDAPTKVSDLPNDVGYITASEFDERNTFRFKGIIEFYTNLPNNAKIGDAYLVNDPIKKTQVIYVYNNGWNPINEVTKEYCKTFASLEAMNNKVDKIEGKGLSECDFTSELKCKLENFSGGSEGGGNGIINYEKIELLEKAYPENLIYNDAEKTWSLPVKVDDFINIGDELIINISEMGNRDINYDMVYVCKNIEGLSYEDCLHSILGSKDTITYKKCCDNPVLDVDCWFVNGKQTCLFKDLGVESEVNTIFVFVSEYDQINDLEQNRLDYFATYLDEDFIGVVKSARNINGEDRVTYEFSFNGFSSSRFVDLLDGTAEFYFYYPASLVKVFKVIDGVEEEISFNKNAKYKNEYKPICKNCKNNFNDGTFVPIENNCIKAFLFVPKCYNDKNYQMPQSDYKREFGNLDYVFVGDIRLFANFDKAMECYRTKYELTEDQMNIITNFFSTMEGKALWQNENNSKWWQYIFLGEGLKYVELSTALLLFKGNAQETFSNAYVPVVQNSWITVDPLPHFTGKLCQFNKMTLIKKGKYV